VGNALAAYPNSPKPEEHSGNGGKPKRKSGVGPGDKKNTQGAERSVHHNSGNPALRDK
jgi:hypothetical protein